MRRHGARLRPVARIERRLTATRLRFRILDRMPQPLEELHHRAGDTRREHVDETWDEKRNAHAWEPDELRQIALDGHGFFTEPAAADNIRIAAKRSAASVADMNAPVRWLLLLCLILGATGCANRERKSSARIYEGDGPSIKYTRERETVGGPVGGR